MKDLLLLILCFWALSLHAQRTISGVVISAEDEERLPFADVVIKGSSQGTSTNVDGYFSLIDVPEDALTLQVLYVGYAPTEINIETGVESITNLKVSLQSGLVLDEVVVSGKSFKVMNASEGLSTVQVSPAQLALLPNVGEVDIFRSLQLLPGVSGSNESSSGLFVRGGTPDQNLVLLDGMTVYNVDHFFGFFSAFNADAVKDVQLFKGAFPAKYGGRLSSVVDLTGKTGDPNKFHSSLGLNLLNVRAGIQVPLFKKGSFSINGRRSYTDLIQSGLYDKIFGVFTQTERPPDIEGIEINTIQPDFYFFDLNSKLSFNPTEKDVLSISYYTGADHLVEFNDVNLEQFGGAVLLDLEVDETTDWGNRGISGKWSRQWGAKWYSNFLIASSNYFSEYNRALAIQATSVEQDSIVLDTDRLTFEDNQVRDLTIRLDNEFQITAKHKLEIGILGTAAEVDYQFIRDDTLNILDLQQTAKYGAAYLSDTWEPFANLSINAGIRATYYDLMVNTNDVFEVEVKYNGITATGATTVPTPTTGLQISQDSLVVPVLPLSAGRDSIVAVLGNFLSGSSINATWDNPDEDLYYMVVESVTDTLDPIFPGQVLEALSGFRFVSEPTNEANITFLAGAIESFGSYSVKVYHINQEYADLYENRNQDSRDLNEPPSNIQNALGVFSAFNSQETFFEVVRE